MVLDRDKKISFPNFVELEICLEPTEMFGVGDKLTKTIECGSAPNFNFSFDTGKYGFVSGHLSEQVDTIFEWPKTNIRVEVHGNKVYAKFECVDINQLEPVIASLLYIFPTILTLKLVEPPVITSIVGRIGDAHFRLGISKSTMIKYQVSTKEIQEQSIKDAFNMLIPITIESNRRLAAALHYFYIAERLIEAGNSPQEFMREVILNYCKVLEILFSENREVVREGLSKLGYSKDEIELNFIPVMILRNEIDVGHVTISMFKQTELNELHNYIGNINADFRELLKLIITKVMDESYPLRLDSDLRPNRKKQKILDDLVNTFKKKNQT
jgi:hypothetical protein